MMSSSGSERAGAATQPASIYRDNLKRVFDLLLVCSTAVVWGPLLAVMALLVRRSLGAPVFFRQQRPGLNGRPFTILKFRTMTDARDEEGRLLPDADRLTPFGRRLRATSLDELPELVHVLAGDMSLVGPRPLLSKYTSLYTAAQARRHLVRPGVTGWAQVNGRNSTTWEERLALDAWYVDHVSFALDVRILLSTVAAVIGRRGISAEGHVTMPEFRGTGNDDRGAT
jgi:lipopolysaccharide/colanic/teichoic acid biosynthesis glycosyltransferase